MENLRDLVETGRKQFASRNFSRAEQLFRKALKDGARYADVYHMLGVIYHNEGKFNDAINCFEEALQINPNYAEANLNLAVLYNDLGDYKAAQPLFKKVQQGKKKPQEINPTLRGKIANLHAELGDLYAGLGRHVEAIGEYQMALKLCLDFKDIQTKLGVSLRENHQREESVKQLSQTVKNFPNYLPARIQLGLSYYAQGEKEKAAREWKSVLKKEKNNPLAQMYLRICNSP